MSLWGHFLPFGVAGADVRFSPFSDVQATSQSTPVLAKRIDAGQSYLEIRLTGNRWLSVRSEFTRILGAHRFRPFTKHVAISDKS